MSKYRCEYNDNGHYEIYLQKEGKSFLIGFTNCEDSWADDLCNDIKSVDVLKAELEVAKSIIFDLLEDDRQSTREIAKEFLNKV